MSEHPAWCTRSHNPNLHRSQDFHATNGDYNFVARVEGAPGKEIATLKIVVPGTGKMIFADFTSEEFNTFKAIIDKAHNIISGKESG